MHFFGGINFWVGRGGIKNAIVTFETCQVFVFFFWFRYVVDIGGQFIDYISNLKYLDFGLCVGR
jgi:hypothetical protein